MFWCGSCKREVDEYNEVCPGCGHKLKTRPIPTYLFLWVPIAFSAILILTVSYSGLIQTHKTLFGFMFYWSILLKIVGFPMYFFLQEQTDVRDLLYLPMYLGLVAFEMMVLLVYAK